ncbi:DUF1211 domain-containing protein [Pseudactinotalea sp. HY160]|uniref:TMEM175 family protein n=1 Tax=Pseudactinotalea sp. HY160 TaxID=2654490 RepID=UPI00128B5DF2|nr:TMEM175 family protein [Pseudactinotalea sp. HY160]MPV49201.1 DUF1211 domain-containing protein [Pseudactinotalea sp. HY160]
MTDAIVAIAMTLLVLPVVDVADQWDVAHPGRWFAVHGDLMLSFVLSFLVIYVFWAAHAAALRAAGDRSTMGAVRVLTMLWLLVIAFLPFPTAVVGHELDTTSAPFYIGTMFVLSVLTSTIVTIAGHHRNEDDNIGSDHRLGWAWVTTAVFGACALISAVHAELGLFALLILLLLRIIEVVGRYRSTAIRLAETGPREEDPS